MVKLTDFGFSNIYNPDKQLDTSCGSLAYSAPEILLGDSYDAPAVGKSNQKSNSFPIRSDHRAVLVSVSLAASQQEEISLKP